MCFAPFFFWISAWISCFGRYGSSQPDLVRINPSRSRFGMSWLKKKKKPRDNWHVAVGCSRTCGQQRPSRVAASRRIRRLTCFIDWNCTSQRKKKKAYGTALGYIYFIANACSLLPPRILNWKIHWTMKINSSLWKTDLPDKELLNLFFFFFWWVRIAATFTWVDKLVGPTLSPTHCHMIWHITVI